MLVVISSPVPVVDEANIINALFDEGLEVLHLRKPGVAIGDIKALIEKIKPPYYHKIALHQYHQIADEIGTGRLHYNVEKRNGTTEEQLTQLNKANKKLSTSVHSVEEYNALPACFDYTFFGPVFNSISKPGYNSVTTGDFFFPVRKGYPKVIAIGGIVTDNIIRAADMHFNGVAALGAIWQKPQESLHQFKILQGVWKQVGRSC